MMKIRSIFVDYDENGNIYDITYRLIEDINEPISKHEFIPNSRTRTTLEELENCIYKLAGGRDLSELDQQTERSDHI